MPKYFGTDGIRGIPFDYPLSKSMIERIGFSIAEVLKDSKRICFVARDTRSSGKTIVRLISRGINLSGVKVCDLGIITTPALSYLVSLKKPSFGIMISASHNPPEYNGIKVFNSDGEKISEELETKIEDMIEKNLDLKERKKIKKTVVRKHELKKNYIDYVVKIFKGIKPFNIALDCSNGSSYKIAPRLFKRLGFNLVIIGDKPNGNNINVGCGAVDTDLLKRVVLKNKLRCGVSYDGDGDRCIIVDENGEIIDGDDILAFFVNYYLDKGILKNKKVVLTHMSNYGLVKFLESKGIDVIFVDVGDRNVYNAMKSNAAMIGGESSGHIIVSNYLNSGDGIITSLEFLRIVSELGIRVSEVKKIWKRYPSLLKSFEVDKKIPLDSIKGFSEFIKNEEKKIDGRIFVRYSGTEPLIRILVEANQSKDFLSKCIDKVYQFYKSEILKLS